MAYDQNMVHTLYRKLLSLYTRGFRERLGESMEQTFHDLCNDRRRQTKRGWSSFVLWMFAETGIGISQDFWPLSLGPEIMVTVAFLLLPVGLMVRGAPLKIPAIIGFLTTLPFMILELVNRWNFNEDFSRIILFVMMWLLPTLFSLTVAPIVRNVRAGNNVLAKPVALVLRVIFLAFLVWLWFGIVIDQMPCFLGVPHCD